MNLKADMPLQRSERRLWARKRLMRRTTTFGRIERGFDFLGYHFSRAGLRVAKKTIVNFIEKASRLYKQERSAP